MDDVNSGGSALAIPHVLTDLKSLKGQHVVKSINGGYNTTCSVNIMAEVSSSADKSIVDSEIYKLDNIIESREDNNADIDNISQASTSKIANLDMDNFHSSSEPHDMVSDSNLSCNGNVNKASISAESDNDIDDPEITKRDDIDNVCDPSSPCTDVAAADVNGIPDISEEDQTNKIKINLVLSENCKPDSNEFSKEGNDDCLSSGEFKSDSEITINNAVEHDNCKNSQAQSTHDSGNGIVAIDEQISNPNESCKSSSAYGVGNKAENSLLDTCTTKNTEAVSEDTLVKSHLAVKSHFLIGDKVRSSLQGLVNKVNMLSNATDTSVSSTCEQAKDKPKSSECEFQPGLHQEEPSPNLQDECCEESMDVIELDSSQDEKEQSEDNDDNFCDKVQTKLKQSVVDTRGDENKLGNETELENSSSTLSVPVDSIKLKENSENLSTCNNNLTQQTKEGDDVLLASSIDDDTYMEIGSDNEEALLTEDTDCAVTGSNENDNEKMDEKADDDVDGDIIFKKEEKAVDRSTIETTNSHIPQNENQITRNPNQDSCEKEPSVDDEDDDVIFESETKADNTVTAFSDMTNIIKTPITDNPNVEKMEEDKIENKDVDDDDDVIFESEEKGNGNINNKTSDTDSSQLKNKIDEEKMEEDTIENKDVDDDDVIFESEEKGNDNINNKTSDNDSSQLKKIIGEEKMEEDKIENKDVDDDDFIFESEEKGNDNINNQTSDTDSSQLKNKIDDEKMEEGKIENKDVDDDDVIFESEEKGNDNINNKTSDTDVSQLKNKMDDKKMEEDKIENKDVDDDDVIFESEEKGNGNINNKTSDTDSSQLTNKIINEDTNTSEKTLKNNEKMCKSDDSDDDIIFEGETKAPVSSTSHSAESLVTPEPIHNDDKETVKMTLVKKEDGDNETTKLLTIGNQNNSSITSEDNEKPEIKESIHSAQSTKPALDRKRPPSDTNDPAEKDAKRSRLDLVIGKLGSAIGIAPDSVEVLDSGNDDEDDDTTDTTVAEKLGESASSEDEEKDDSEDDSDDDEKKYIQITEPELDQLVREKVACYLITQRDTLIAQLQQKVKDLQISNDNWKAQVKDLQVKVNEVTVLQQKHEKRKAATAALRQITSRNVAVQVDDGKMGLKTARNPSVKSLLDQTRQQPTAAGTPVSTTPVTPTSVNVIQYPQRFVTQNGTQGFILAPTPPNPPTSIKSPPTKPVASVATTLPSTAFKIIDLTADDDGNKGAQRLVSIPIPTSSVAPALRSTVTGTSATQIVFNPPMNSQLVRTTVPQQQSYQLVFNNTSPALRSTVAGISPMPQTVLAVAQQTPTQQTPTQQTPTQQTAGVAATSLVSTTRTFIPSVVSTSTVPVVPPTPPIPVLQHPAPFPVLPNQRVAGCKNLPPKPSLKISRVSQGIVLSWNMSLNDTYADISNYQLFAYQETASAPSTLLWKKVGDVKALPLPMACTLTQFQVGNKYHFAVRAMDAHNRVGMFSDPSSIHLTPLVPK